MNSNFEKLFEELGKLYDKNLDESRKYATDTPTDYEMAYNNMDHFMTDDEEATEQFYQITDCQELADFLDDNMTDMEAFLEYAGPEATVDGFANYIISNGLNNDY